MIVAEIMVPDRKTLLSYKKNLSWIKGKTKIVITEGKPLGIRYLIGSSVLKEWKGIPSGKTLLEEYYSLLEEG